MAAIPVSGEAVSQLLLWIELTDRLVSKGAILSADTITQARAKAVLEQAAN